MASRIQYEFVEELPGDCTCSICTNVLEDPVLIECCGQNFCGYCLKKWLKRTKSCPHCRSSELRSIKDRRSKRRCEKLAIYCPNEGNGCGHVITISSYTEHLDICKYSWVLCNNKCGKKMLRKYLGIHLETDCPNREVTCMYCKIKGIHKDITAKTHLDLCAFLPLPCPNRCGEDGIHRRNIPIHKQVCPLEIVECTFAKAGCEVKIVRQDLQRHLSECTQHHLTLVSMVALKSQQELAEVKQELARVVAASTSSVQAEMPANPQNRIQAVPASVITLLDIGNRFSLQFNFLPICSKRSGAFEAASEPFYLMPGYKFSISIMYTPTMYTPVNKSIKEWVLNLYMQPDKYDDSLPWPIPNKYDILLQTTDSRILAGQNSTTIQLCTQCRRGWQDKVMEERSIFHSFRTHSDVKGSTSSGVRYIPTVDFYIDITIMEHKCEKSRYY